MAEELILDIQIPTSDVQKAEQDIAKMRGAVEKLREENKKLDKSSEAYTKNALEIKRLNGEIRTNERVLIANTKAQKANEGSVAQLRQQLSVVSQQWAELSKEERENTKEGKALAQQKKQLTDQLKSLEKQTGDNRRNVGNYSQGMREAIKSSGGLSKASSGLNAVMNLNPAMAVAGALLFLGQKMGEVQSITDFFNRTLQPLNAIFQRFIGLVQEGAQKFLPSFTNGIGDLKQTLIDLGKNVLDLLILNRIEAIGMAAAAVQKIFTKDWRQGLEDLGNAATQAITGIEDLPGKIQRGAAATKTFFSEAIAEGQRLAELTVQLEEAQNDLILTEGRLRREIEEQRLAVEDVTKTQAERKEAAEAALKAVNDLEAARLEVLNKEIEAAEIRAAQNDTDRKAQAELNKLLAQRDEIAAQSASQSKEIRNQLNRINEEQRKAAQQAIDDARKRSEEEKAAAEKAAKEEVERQQKLLEKRLQNIEQTATKELNVLKSQLLDQTITREQYEEQLAQIQMASLLARQELLRDDADAQIEIEQEILDFKLASAEKQEKAIEKLNKFREEQAKKQLEIEAKAAESSAQLAAQAVGTVAGLLGEETAAYKILMSAQALITTYANATKAYQSQLSIPTPDAPARAAIAAAIATAQGLAQVAAINAVPVKKFATGVIGLDGPGTATSDSIPARLSKGESVITAKASKVYAPVLAEMERSVGNNPNWQIRNGRFARGIIGAGTQPSLIQSRITRQAQQALPKAIGQQRIFVSLTELERDKRKFDKAKRFAKITE